MYSITYKSIIILLLSILPIIDSFNGFLLMSGKSSIGELYKIFMLLITGIWYLSYKKFNVKDIIGILFPIIYVFMSIVINLIVDYSGGTAYDHAIKLLFNLTFMKLLYSFISKNKIDKEFFEKVFDVNTILIIIVILIPKMINIGYSTYATGQGYKGFYYAQNELNALLLIIYTYNINKLFNVFNMKNLIKTVLISFCIFILETKSSMLLGIIIPAVYCLHSIIFKKFKYKTLLIICIIFSACMIVKSMDEIIVSFVTRQQYLMKNFNGAFLPYITSGRSIFVINSFNSLKEGPFFILKLFIGSGFKGTKLVEMDIIDIFFYLGLIGVIYIVIYLIKILKIIIINKDSILDIFDILIIFTFSFFTGHVLFMATSGVYFVLFCCYKSLRKNNTN